MPGWRNGYTRTTQNRVEKSVEVRLLFPAQLKYTEVPPTMREGGIIGQSLKQTGGVKFYR